MLDNDLKMLRTDDERRLHRYCVECKDKCTEAGKNWEQTTSKCHGIYGEEDFTALAQLTGVDIDEIREIYDPSHWVRRYLGMLPYWYQDRYLRCTSIRRALRWGRRTGKTETICADLVRRCLTIDNYKVLAVTPMKSQAKEIADRVLKFLEEGDNLRRECVRSVQQPYYEFNFANGSRIRVFVAGTSSGTGAGTQIRGQEGDFLLIDEADYLDDDATKAILPILSDPSRHGEPVAFTISSTPSGKEGMFFRLCHDDAYREMHCPSRSRPDWNAVMEGEARRIAKTQQNYTHEYDADWGSKKDGVFPRHAIIAAQQEYRYHTSEGHYEEQKWPEMCPWGWTYMMGVDWNGPGNGTRIAIIGYSHQHLRWILVYREVIAAEKFSLHVAIDRIVRLNRLWNCYAIYLDAGFGQMQDEVLRSIGRVAVDARRIGQHYEVADIALADRLQSVDFGSWIEYDTEDPITKAILKVKKRKKNFIVENLQRHMELNSFWFSKGDNDFKAQLMGYHAPRKGQHNELIYKADPEAGDHDLDAVLLGMYAFLNEFDPLFAPQQIATAPIVMSRPEPGREIEQVDENNPFGTTRHATGQNSHNPAQVPSRTIEHERADDAQTLAAFASIGGIRSVPASISRNGSRYQKPPSRTNYRPGRKQHGR